MDKITVLEEIIKEIGEELYQKWYNAPSDVEKTQEWSEIMAKNSSETSLWVIQTFMSKFNAAAEELKDK